ncbi:hypothetical protein GOV07_04450 [Candidatus Woesearchaeota archaeon]|nr:hypothetical protein [Candidatus Woesearchaeota archaeon]
MANYRISTSLDVGGRPDQIAIDGFLPIINHPLFQRLRHRRQNGLSNSVYDGLNHTRANHSLGAAALTHKVTEKLVENEEIGDLDAYALRHYALVHDLGHPPYCHAMEQLLVDIAKEREGLPMDHKDHTEALYLSDVRDERGNTIQDCIALSRNGDTDRVFELLRHQDSIHKIVSAKVIGTEKLDYITRDARHAAFTNTVELGLLIENLHFLRGQYGINEKHKQLIPELMSLYVNLYDRVYFHKRCLAMERVLQKGAQWAIELEGLDPAKVWNMIDSDLDVALRTTSRNWINQMGERYLNNVKYGTGVGIVPGKLGIVTRKRHKDEVLVEVSQEQYEELVRKPITPLQATKIEGDIAKLLSIPHSDIVIATVPRPDKMLPDDVQIFDRDGHPNGTIFERRPHLQDGLRSEAESAGIIRIYGHETSAARTIIAKNAEKVADLVIEKLSA